MSTAIAWFRRDLRLADNPALAFALQQGGVVPAVVLDPQLLGVSPRRAALYQAAVASLGRSLEAAGSRLVVRTGRPAEIIPELARNSGANLVVAARDLSPGARMRDQALAAALADEGRRLQLTAGTFAVEPEQVPGPSGSGYAVFAAFYRRWTAAGPRAPIPAPLDLPAVPASVAGDRLVAHHPLAGASEREALDRLTAWRVQIGRYQETRDEPGTDGTSRLSIALRLGLLSPAQVLAATPPEGPGAEAFRREIAWRDFAGHLLWHRPSLLCAPFDPAYAALPWRSDPAGLRAWREGNTGYPIVDAGMRQLAATGWVHNRVRMICASFLAKHLLVDWREGARHFLRELSDGDPASNAIGWQWAASTGADAQPYFRVFNPVLQGERHDPEGAYVREWVPELRAVPSKYVHRPWEMPAEMQLRTGCLVGQVYPAPLVDHRQARARAIATFAAVKRR